MTRKKEQGLRILDNNARTPFDAKMQELVVNTMLMREQWIRGISDPRRNVDEECRYPRIINPRMYRQMFNRFGIGKRVVSVEPLESWKGKPEIYDDEDSDETPFEEAFQELNTRHKLYSRMLKADIMSGIGRYGIVLFGIDDGQPLSTPVKGFPKNGTLEPGYKIKRPSTKLLFMRVFDESMARVTAWENDTKNPRFGLPKQYTLVLLSPEDLDGTDAEALQPLAGQDTRVHWTRVVHIARDTTTSEVLGTPAQEDCWNHLLDLKKICGAGAEGYWQGAFPGLSFETQPNLENFDIDVASLKKQARKYFEKMQRYIATQGMNVKSLAPNVQDPASQFEVAIKAICTTKACPYRIFMGTEEAKLAGGQDNDNWDDRMIARRENFNEPDIARPIVDRLIAYNCLPVPNEQKYKCDWPDMHEASELDQAKIAQAITAALQAYVSAGIDELLTPEDYLIHVMKMDPKVVETVMKNSMKRHQDVNDGEDVVMGGPSPEEIAQQAQQELIQKQQMRGGGIKKPSNGKPTNGKPAPGLAFGNKAKKGKPVRNFNPYHKGSGPGGGEFVSGPSGKSSKRERVDRLVQAARKLRESNPKVAEHLYNLIGDDPNKAEAFLATVKGVGTPPKVTKGASSLYRSLNEISPTQKAIETDFQDFAEDLNSTLRQDEELTGDEKKFATLMDKQIESEGKQLSDRTVLYRGLTHDIYPEEGKRFTDKGYTSLAASKAIAQEAYSSGTMARVELPSGTKLLEIGRGEFVLPRGASFKVLDKKTSGDADTVVRLKLVAKKGSKRAKSTR